MKNVAKRPTSVTVIGWLYIVTAIFIFIYGAIVLVAIKQAHEGGASLIPKDMPMQLKVMMVFAVFVLIAGIDFLKLKSWARTTLEIVSWLSLFCIIGFGIYWVISLVLITSGVEGSSASIPMSDNMLEVVMVTVITVFFAIPIIVILKFLRGTAIKEAVCRRR